MPVNLYMPVTYGIIILLFVLQIAGFIVFTNKQLASKLLLITGKTLHDILLIVLNLPLVLFCFGTLALLFAFVLASYFELTHGDFTKPFVLIMPILTLVIPVFSLIKWKDSSTEWQLLSTVGKIFALIIMIPLYFITRLVLFTIFGSVPGTIYTISIIAIDLVYWRYINNKKPRQVEPILWRFIIYNAQEIALLITTGTIIYAISLNV